MKKHEKILVISIVALISILFDCKIYGYGTALYQKMILLVL